MDSKISFIENRLCVKNFDGSFKVSKEILNILDLSKDFIFWKKSDNEIIIFTNESWRWFVDEMKNKKGFSGFHINYTKKGNDFIRCLYSLAHPINLRKNNELYLSGNSRIRKILKGKDLDISFCF